MNSKIDKQEHTIITLQTYKQFMNPNVGQESTKDSPETFYEMRTLLEQLIRILKSKHADQVKVCINNQQSTIYKLGNV